MDGLLGSPTRKNKKKKPIKWARAQKSKVAKAPLDLIVPAPLRECLNLRSRAQFDLSFVWSSWWRTSSIRSRRQTTALGLLQPAEPKKRQNSNARDSSTCGRGLIMIVFAGGFLALSALLSKAVAFLLFAWFVCCCR